MLRWEKAAYGLVAGGLTVFIFSVDRIEFLSFLHRGVWSYSITLPFLLFIGVMGFIGGYKREFDMSLTYIISMALYDLLTDDMKTVIFAAIPCVTVLIGAGSSVLVSKLTKK